MKLSIKSLILIRISLFFWSSYFYLREIFHSNFLWNLFLLTFIIVHLIILYKSKINFKSNKENFRFDKIDYIFIILIFIGFLILNFKFLNASILYKGDEGFHFYRAFKFYGRIVNNLNANAFLFFTLPIIFIISLLVTFYILFRKYKKLLLINIFISLLVSFFCSSLYFSFFMKMHCIGARYPPFVAFIQNFLIVLNPLTRFSELINRFVSFLPLVFISVSIYFYLKLIKIKNIYSMLISIVFLTMPFIIFHSSIIYLEPFMIFIISIATLIMLYMFENQNEDRHLVSFILGLSGFVKESAFPVLFAFFLFFIYLEIFTKNEKLFKKIKNLLIDFILIFLPLIFYLIIRLSYNERSHGMNFLNVLNVDLYRFYFVAIMNQFNLILFILIVFSLVYSIVKKKYFKENILAILIIGMNFIYFATDQIIFNGYSRFNLGYIPAIIIYLIILAKIINIYKNKIIFYLSVVVCLILIGTNLYLSPFSFKERNDWGTPGCETGEYYYPYNQLFKWLQTNHSNKKIVYYNPFYSYSTFF